MTMEASEWPQKIEHLRNFKVSVNHNLKLMFCCHPECQTYVQPESIKQHFTKCQHHINDTTLIVDVDTLMTELEKRNIPMSTIGSNDLWWKELKEKYMEPSNEKLHPIPNLTVLNGFVCTLCEKSSKGFYCTVKRAMLQHYNNVHDGYTCVEYKEALVQALFKKNTRRKFFPVLSRPDTPRANSSVTEGSPDRQDLDDNILRKDSERYFNLKGNSAFQVTDMLERNFPWTQCLDKLGISREEAVNLILASTERRRQVDDIDDVEVDEGEIRLLL